MAPDQQEHPIRPYERLLSAVTGPKWFGAIGRRVVTPIDRRLRDSRFAPTRLGTELPLCYLTTTGRRSGEPRTTPLLFITTEGGFPAVVATNFGAERHPGWSYNLEADPNAELQVGDETRTVVARRAEGAELSGLWDRFIDRWPNYARYRDRIDRDVRLYVLEG